MKMLGETELGVSLIKTPKGGNQSNQIVSESGLYKLVMWSDKPQASPFQDWVTGTVMPAIRKDGGYIMGEEEVVSGELSEDEFVLKAMSILHGKVERLKLESVKQAQSLL